MKNVIVKKDGSKLVVTVDMSKNFGPSKSGKSTIIASTEGNENIEGGTYLGLNVYKKS